MAGGGAGMKKIRLQSEEQESFFWKAGLDGSSLVFTVLLAGYHSFMGVQPWRPLWMHAVSLSVDSRIKLRLARG